MLGRGEIGEMGMYSRKMGWRELIRLYLGEKLATKNYWKEDHGSHACDFVRGFVVFPQQYSESCWTSENKMDSVEMISR